MSNWHPNKHFNPTQSIHINPGSGPVRGKNLKSNAINNISQFLQDVGGNSEWEYIKKQEDGRFLFVISSVVADVEVEMPGLPLEEVRYIDKNNQNIWDFDRLYINGSSWVWLYAVQSMQELLEAQ